MNVEQILRDDAEQSEYYRVVSKRIGELAAAQVDPQTIIYATDDDLRSIAATLVVVILNELGEEALDYATTTSEALGFKVPPLARDFALEASTEATVNRLYAELEEQRARFQKAAAATDGVLSAGIALGITAALAPIFADAAQGIATDLAVELNRALAQAEATLAQGAAADAGAADAAAAAEAETAVGAEASLLDQLLGIAPRGAAQAEPELRWITRHDARVCDEDGPEVETPSGVILPPGAGTSCLKRHGVILPASDWTAEGLPRDPRLLCSRFKRPRCRCMVAAARVEAPEAPVNIAPDVARGKERGMAEEIDLQPAHLDAAFRAVSRELTPLIDPNVFELKIRVRKRAPVPAAPALAGARR